MKIISLINSKGGVGKTTLSINLAMYLQMQTTATLHDGTGASGVLLVDADPQGSIRDWYEQGGHRHLDMIALDRPHALLDLKRDKLGYEYVIIDTPGKVDNLMASAINVSDLVLIPIQPSPYDIWATEQVVELINSRHALAGTMKPLPYFILNRCIPNTNIGRDVLEYLEEHPFSYLPSLIYQRVAYASSAMLGGTIFTSGNTQGITEIQSLGHDIKVTINGLEKIDCAKPDWDKFGQETIIKED